MRVAVVDDAGFGWGRPGLAGKELYVELLARGLEGLGVGVVRVLLGGSSGDGDVVVVRGVGTPVVRDFWDWELVRGLRRVFEGVDLVHVNVLNARYPRNIVRVVKDLGVPMVVTVHDWSYLCPTGWSIKFPSQVVDWNPRLGLSCIRCIWGVAKVRGDNPITSILRSFNHTVSLRELLFNASAIISPSKLLADALVRAYGVKNVYAIYNPVPDELLKLRPSYGGDGSVAFFARLSPEKGVYLLPAIARELRGVRIHVMGDGPLRDFVVRVSKEFPNIVYHGFVSNEEKIEIVGKSSLVIFPIIWMETFSYTVVESFALGKPVVSFDLGGPKELIEGSGAGLLARPFDVGDFVGKVRYLLNNPDIVKDMGFRGRAFVESLTPRNYVSRVLEIYREIL